MKTKNQHHICNYWLERNEVHPLKKKWNENENAMQSSPYIQSIQEHKMMPSWNDFDALCVLFWLTFGHNVD